MCLDPLSMPDFESKIIGFFRLKSSSSHIKVSFYSSCYVLIPIFILNDFSTLAKITNKKQFEIHILNVYIIKRIPPEMEIITIVLNCLKAIIFVYIVPNSISYCE